VENLAIVDVTAERYNVEVRAPGFVSATIGGVAIFPGATGRTSIVLRRVNVIATVTARAARGPNYAGSSDAYTISGEAARAPAVATGSGLGSYTAGTVQGAVATAPGIQQDQFANVISRGGQSDDVIFSYDGVPVPQALIAEPGGNVIGAQLPTTGVAFTNLSLGGFNASPDVALGAAVDEVPFGGTYPQQTSLELGAGITPGAFNGSLVERWATPDLRVRYAFDMEASREAFGAFGLVFAQRLLHEGVHVEHRFLRLLSEQFAADGFELAQERTLALGDVFERDALTVVVEWRHRFAELDAQLPTGDQLLRFGHELEQE